MKHELSTQEKFAATIEYKLQIQKELERAGNLISIKADDGRDIEAGNYEFTFTDTGFYNSGFKLLCKNLGDSCGGWGFME